MDFNITIVSAALVLIIGIIIYGLIPLAYAYNVKTSVTPKKYRIVCLISFVVTYVFLAIVGFILEGEALASLLAVFLWTLVFYKTGMRILRKRGYLDDGKSVMVPNEKNELCPFCQTGVSRKMKVCPACGYDLKAHFESNPIEEEERPLMEKQKVKNSHQGRKLLMALVVIVVVLFVALFCMLEADEKGSVSIAKVADSVLYLEIYNEDREFVGTASGFLVNDKNTLVTNHHVVENTGYLCAIAENGDEAWAEEILYWDEVSDLAVLSLEEDMDVKPLIIANSDRVEQGDEVYAVGYPLGIANTISDGIVSSRYYNYEHVDIIQTTAAISKGNSGGPLVNEDGHVIGVICAYHNNGQNLNLAVSSNTLKELMSGKTRSEEEAAWEDRALVKTDEVQGTEEEETQIKESPEAKEEENAEPEQSVREEKAPVSTLPVKEEKASEYVPPVEEEEPEEPKEIIPVITVSETEVTVTDSATIYVTCESADGEEYVMSVSTGGSQAKIEWGKKEGNTIPLIISPWEKR